MNKRIVGKCSQCGGIVSVLTTCLSVKPPVPQCEKCHAFMDVYRDLPFVPMIPNRSAPKPFQSKSMVNFDKKRRPRLAPLLAEITEENRHEEVDFGFRVGKEII